MTVRTQQQQSIHDRAIAGRRRSWAGDSRYIQSWANPGPHQNAGYQLNGIYYYPDLIIKLGSDGSTQHIIEEIETADSVTPNEVPQWAVYAALPQPTWFSLLVPVSVAVRAQSLAKGLDLWVIGYAEAHLGVFTYSEAVRPLR